MGYKTYKKIGNTRIDIEADSLKSLLQMAAQFPAVEKCDNCDSTEIYPSHKTTKDGDHYYFIECQKCGATFPLGQKKEGGALYYKRDSKFEVYKPKEEKKEPVQQKKESNDDDDVPF